MKTLEEFLDHVRANEPPSIAKSVEMGVFVGLLSKTAFEAIVFMKNHDARKRAINTVATLGGLICKLHDTELRLTPEEAKYSLKLLMENAQAVKNVVVIVENNEPSFIMDGPETRQ